MTPTSSAPPSTGTVPPPGSSRRRGTAVPSGLLGVAGIAGFLVTWELVVRSGLVEPQYLPAASTVLAELASIATTATFWEAVGWTLRTWAIGLAVSGAAAIVLGLVIGGSRFLRRATHSTVEFLRPIPSVALIPLAVLLYGTSMQATLLLVVYAAFWQVLIQILYGVRDVDPVADDTARSYGLGWTARVRYLVWPSALPYVMTGVRLGAAVALILTITGELVIGGGGVGTQIALAQSGGAVPEMYALVVTTGLIGVAINLLVRAVERRALRWHVSVRREAVA
ncbi:ABC transporter permease [Mumia zhuanghuii]|uniref:ABC transporter permease n=1 Tax=Mumia zhuanghuii TaxID=2585211 RepID=A0A5C4MN38_9ACTN|nr:ABC transporter permease [Mumia zhuanghuii]TNC45251.1 ABC transporter permease [Mumia zhuanghuii]TNC47441.1 ABC transporter permease [Mumia zhuanghuii]